MGEGGGREGKSDRSAESGRPRSVEEAPAKPIGDSRDRSWPLTDPMRQVRLEREQAVSQIHRSLAAWRKESAAKSTDKAAIPSGGGAPLPAMVRQGMEANLGADLGGAKIHTGGDSAKAAADLGARAFTVGADVHFGSGEFAPGTKEGDKLLAHELTHVVQGQRSGVQRKADEHTAGDSGAVAAGEQGIAVSQPGEPAEREADAVADHVSEKLHGKGEAAADAAHGATDKAQGAKEKAPAIGAKLTGAGAILRKKDDKKDESKKPADKTATAGKDANSKPAAAGQMGRGLDVFAVAKSAVEGVVTVDGQELMMEFKGKGLDGSAIDLGHGAVELDEAQQPADYPHFTILSTHSRDGREYAVHLYDQVELGPAPAPGAKPLPVGKGARTPTTQFAIEKFLSYYERRFGHGPEKLYGLLAWSNKLNFQREYYKLKRAGVSAGNLAEEAVKRISFGKHRVALGYNKFEFELGQNMDVPLGKDPETGKDLGTQEVPGRIVVWAARSKK